MLERLVLLLTASLALVLSGCNKNTPEITSPLIATGTIGQPFSYRITANGEPTTYTASPLPAGLSLDQNSGIISGYPTVASTSSITVGAANYDGQTDTAELAVTIVNGNITPGLDVSILVGDGTLPPDSPPANNRVAAFDDMTGFSWETFGGANGNEIGFPFSVFSDSQGRIYHVDVNLHRVVRMNSMAGDGFIAYGSLGSSVGKFTRPSGIFVTKAGQIYIADSGNNRIVRINDMSGSGWTALGSYGSGKGDFNTPFQVFVDAANRIYVADTLNDRIVRCNDMIGSAWVSLGTTGSGERNFSSPIGLAIDPLFRIYVADSNNSRIIRMADMEGNTWTALGSVGHGSQQFDHPRGLYVSRSGKIYVADSYNQRIVRMVDMSGSEWTTFGTFGERENRFINPCGIFVIETPYTVGQITLPTTRIPFGGG